MSEGRGCRRRKYLQVAGALATGSLVGCVSGTGSSGGNSSGNNSSGGGDKLNYLTWGGNYAGDIKAFENEHNVTVNTTTYTNNADSINKLRQSSEGTFDLFQPSGYTVGRALNNEMIEPIGVDNLPVYGKIFDYFKRDLFDQDGKTYAIPMTFGVVGLIHESGMGIDDTPSIDLLWDDQYKNRFAVRDTAKDQIFWAALKTGQDPNNPSDLDSIEEALMKQIKLLETTWTNPPQARQMFTGNEIKYTTGQDSLLRDLSKHDVSAELKVFEEGARGFVDTFAIPKGAKHKKLAKKYINYTLTKKARWLMEESGYGVASKTVNYSDEERKAYGLSENLVEDYIFQTPISNEKQQKYSQIWNRVKSSQ